jgi:hypothetical protein
LFFFGQAAAAASCWPFKILIESITSHESVQIGVSMLTISLVSISIIPVFMLKIRYMASQGGPTEDDTLSRDILKSGPDSVIVGRHQTGTLSWKNAQKILRQSWLPFTCLWLTYLCTNMVTPGQVTTWPLPTTKSESGFLTNPQLYRSLCSYTHLLADAFGKSLVVVLSMNAKRIRSFLTSRWSIICLLAMAACRIGLLVLFFLPPSDACFRFVVLSIFGILNGVVASLCVSLSTHRADSKDTDIAGYINSFIIINGLFIGSLFGMLTRLVRTT